MPLSTAPSASLCPFFAIPSRTPSSVQVRWLSHPLSAGFPSPAADYEEETLDLNDYLVRRPAATFIFNVDGNSMQGAGIEIGDKVIVDRSVTPGNRHIVVAVVDAGYTLKRLIIGADGRPELHAENPAYPPRRFDDGEQLEIWGVVIGVVRRYG